MSFKARIASAATRAFARSARVVRADRVSPGVVRVRLDAPAIRDAAIAVGAKIKVHVGEGELRSYTPAAVDPEAGWMDLVVHIHGESLGSRWAQGLTPEDAVAWLGPAKSVAGPDPDIAWAGFFGDETTLGLAEAIAGALPRGVPMVGAIEVSAADREAVRPTTVTAVERSARGHGHALVESLETIVFPAGVGTIWLSGEAGSVLALREALLSRGVARDRLRIKPYWSLKGKAHRKALERTLLKA